VAGPAWLGLVVTPLGSLRLHVVGERHHGLKILFQAKADVPPEGFHESQDPQHPCLVRGEPPQREDDGGEGDVVWRGLPPESEEGLACLGFGFVDGNSVSFAVSAPGPLRRGGPLAARGGYVGLSPRRTSALRCFATR
jgi:hypothetical protein